MLAIIIALLLHVILLARASHWANKTYHETKRTNELIDYYARHYHR